MGCSASHAFSDERMKPETSVLQREFNSVQVSDRDKHYIKRTWKGLSKRIPEIGAKIFLLIFDRYPHIKKIFPCRDVTGDELLQDSHFRGHASRFMQAVGAAVENIHDLDKAMAPLLFGLGEQHIHFDGFEMNYFEAFVEAIMQVFGDELGSKFTANVSQAWLTVFRFIQQTLRDGYIHAKQVQASNETT